MLLGVFSVALFFFISNMKEVTFHEDIETVEMKEAQFPIMKIISKQQTMNVLHGYNNNLDANLMRESMTPIGSDQSFQMRLKENGYNIKKVNYQLHNVSNNEVLETKEILALDETEEGIAVNVSIDTAMKQGKEYAFKITATTDNGKKIHYFTRLKYYNDECYLKEKMDFVKKLHEASFHKNKAQNYIKYFETDYSASQDNFAKVNIKSNVELFTWGELKPEILTEVIPTIKEFNIETAAVSMDYYVKANVGSGDEIYLVKEFYRIRYTKDGVYQLLKYDRNMEAVFDMNKTSVSKNELKIGITQKQDIKFFTNEDNTKVSFVRERALWLYNIVENSAVQIFSFLDGSDDYEKGGYDQHDICILDMDQDGNMNFMVYGYMNRGDYEGSVGIVLYKYYANEKRVEEQVYIPLETTYQMLKEDLNSFSYVNEKNNFYFSIHNMIYNYNIAAKKLNIIASNVKNENLVTVEESGYILWQDAETIKDAKVIHILDLEEEKERTIDTKEGEIIQILGKIDSNMIYGFGKLTDIAEGSDGNDIIPLYQIEIADSQGNVLKKYKEKNIYVIAARVENNIVKLDRVQKSNGVFQKIASDSILTKEETIKAVVKLSKRVTDVAMTEYYIALLDGNPMTKEPSISKTLCTIITENRTLRLHVNENQVIKYYLYAQGQILESYTNPAQAIIDADNAMGVVVSSNHEIVWERGGKYTNNTIGGLTKVNAGSEYTSVNACVQMLLKQNNIQVSAASDLNKKKISAYKVLKENLGDKVINLTGCNLDQVLYYVSGGRGVLAMKDKNNAVLITGYDTTKVTMFDPNKKADVQMSLEKAEKMFEDAGYVFLSYLP